MHFVLFNVNIAIQQWECCNTRFVLLTHVPIHQKTINKFLLKASLRIEWLQRIVCIRIVLNTSCLHYGKIPITSTSGFRGLSLLTTFPFSYLTRVIIRVSHLYSGNYHVLSYLLNILSNTYLQQVRNRGFA